MAAEKGEQRPVECHPAECPIRRVESEQGGRAIGAMNGKWAFLLKLVLITTPAAWAIFVTVDLPWRVWVTKAAFASNEHQHHAAALTKKLDEYITAREADYRALDERIDGLPAAEWRKRIIDLENWERENRQDHADILISLEAIKAKLNIPPGARQQQGGNQQLPYNQETRNETATASLRGGDGPGSDSGDSS